MPTRVGCWRAVGRWRGRPDDRTWRWCGRGARAWLARARVVLFVAAFCAREAACARASARSRTADVARTLRRGGVGRALHCEIATPAGACQRGKERAVEDPLRGGGTMCSRPPLGQGSLGELYSIEMALIACVGGQLPSCVCVAAWLRAERCGRLGGVAGSLLGVLRLQREMLHLRLRSRVRAPSRVFRSHDNSVAGQCLFACVACPTVRLVCRPPIGRGRCERVPVACALLTLST